MSSDQKCKGSLVFVLLLSDRLQRKLTAEHQRVCGFLLSCRFECQRSHENTRRVHSVGPFQEFLYANNFRRVVSVGHIKVRKLADGNSLLWFLKIPGALRGWVGVGRRHLQKRGGDLAAPDIQELEIILPSLELLTFFTSHFLQDPVL